ncbi:MAG: hypothetical protein H6557_22680 [Lewinellaceae bacterium]|nr:hypothetical protein [Lewinellaceae bacterium]
MGNTRLGFSDFNQNGLIELTEDDPTTTINELEITQEAHYYPFGMNHDGPCLVHRSLGGGGVCYRGAGWSVAEVPNAASGRTSTCIMARS